MLPGAGAAPLSAGWDGGAAWTHEEGPTGDPGDDRVDAEVAVREVWVRSSAGRPASLTFDPGEVVLRHDAFTVLNATWIDLNDSRPQAVRGLVAFESRPHEVHRDGAWQPSGSWGIFLMADPPGGVAGYDRLTLFWFCWSVCERASARWAATNETEIRPFPPEIALGQQSTSESFTRALRRADSCPRPQDPAFCSALAATGPAGTALADAADRVSPEARLALLVDEARIELGAPAEAADAVPGRWTPAEGARPPMTPATSRAPPGGPSPQAPAAVERIAPAPPAATLPPPSAGEAPRILGLLGEEFPTVALPVVALAAAGLALLLLGLLLYHRVARQSALAQATRSRVFAMVCAEPGLRVGTIASRLSLDYTSVRHHVRLLEKLGMVRGVAGGQRRLYATGLAPPALAETARLLSAPSVRAVLDHLRSGRTVEQAGISPALGLAASTVTEALQRLAAANMIEVDRRGGRRWVRLMPPGESASRGAAQGG